MRVNKKTIFVGVLGLLLFISTLFITLISSENPVLKAVVGMRWGLIFLWVVIGGTLMHKNRERIRFIVQNIRLPWQIVFLLFTLFLVFIEEAIATAMTNLAPFFGVPVGVAYITASANFFDVIFFHSAINFIGLFVAWAILLTFYDFSSFSAFVIFGITGLIAEVLFGGISNIVDAPLWIFVYGLMIYLPVYCIPPKEERGARSVRWYHYIVALLLPLIFSPLFFWVPYLIDPNHPQPLHYPPLQRLS